MLNELLKSVVWRTTTATDGGANGPVVFTSTGTKVLFTAVAPVRLLKWGFLANNVAVAQTSSAMAFSLSSLPQAGGSATVIDTLTTVASSSFALGTGGYRETFTPSTAATTPPSQNAQAGPIGNTANTTESGQQQMTLSVGQQWQIAVTTASDNTGTGVLFLEYVLLPISKPSGYGFTTDPDYSPQPGSVSLTDNYTQFAS